jgi:hypothetical protein
VYVVIDRGDTVLWCTFDADAGRMGGGLYVAIRSALGSSSTDVSIEI